MYNLGYPYDGNSHGRNNLSRTSKKVMSTPPPQTCGPVYSRINFAEDLSRLRLIDDDDARVEGSYGASHLFDHFGLA